MPGGEFLCCSVSIFAPSVNPFGDRRCTVPHTCVFCLPHAWTSGSRLPIAEALGSVRSTDFEDVVELRGIARRRFCDCWDGTIDESCSYHYLSSIEEYTKGMSCISNGEFRLSKLDMNSSCPRSPRETEAISDAMAGNMSETRRRCHLCSGSNLTLSMNLAVEKIKRVLCPSRILPLLAPEE